MIRVRIWGGLGNQLFQYAFAKSITLKYGFDVEIEKSWYQNMGDATPRTFELDRFEIDLPITDPGDPRRCGKTKYEIVGELIEIEDDTYYVGYWQDPKYFKGMDAQIRKNFIFKGAGKYEQISPLEAGLCRDNTVSIHVRRGDYTKIKNHPICGLDYYRRATRILRENQRNVVFFVFSDDIDWCRNNFGFLDENCEFIDTGSELTDWYLMTKTKHHIIANSSFSWWAAWIGNNNGKVIMPEKWLYSDAYDALRCDGWIWI